MTSLAVKVVGPKVVVTLFTTCAGCGAEEEGLLLLSTNHATAATIRNISIGKIGETGRGV